jgi:thiamine pyrophosphate-dependent acetolactate synthase large subunit-like protein
VVVNDVYEITGGQLVPGAGRVDFAALARATGFARVFHFEEAVAYEAALDEILAGPGPTFVSVHVEAGSEGVISRTPGEPARYLQTSLADWSARMREALLDAGKSEDGR